MGLMPRVSKKTAGAVLLFFLCTLNLTSGGRLGSVDAGSQLQAATLLARTGQLGAVAPPTLEPVLWVPNAKGLFYQCHDVGNLFLMFPAALLGSSLSRATTAEIFENPPPLSRVAVSLTYGLFAALGCFFLFLFFCRLYDSRRAFLLTLAFAFTTFFWAYTKTAWDVMGSAVGACFVLYASARAMTAPVWENKDFALLGLAVAIAGSFRFSLFPSLLLGVAALGFLYRDRLKVAPVAAFLTTVLATMLPAFAYNLVRMGNPFQPATMAPQFATTSDLQGNVFYGLYGLLLSPNKGLFWFAPVLLLLFALPWHWKQLPKWARDLALSMGAVTFSYLLLVSKIRNWGTFGWGPRYLVPVLPFLFFFSAVSLVELWRKYRAPLVGLLALSFCLNLAPVLVNWSLAIADPQTSNAHLFFPYQHQAIWKGLFNGLRGIPLAAPAEVLADPVRSAGARFPDLWLVRLMETSRAGNFAGLTGVFLLLFGIGGSLGRLRAERRE